MFYFSLSRVSLVRTPGSLLVRCQQQFKRKFAMQSLNLKPEFKDESLLRKGSYVNGKWITEGEDYFEVTDPANGALISKLPNHDVGVVQEAIKAANSTFKTYKNMPPKDRAQCLRRMYSLMMENIDDLSALITWENGKPLNDAINEVRYAASFFDWFADEALRMYGTTIQPANPTSRAFTIRQPVGVCGIVCPWNFPAAMISRKASAALAAGCTVVLKPDPQTPLSALALAHLIEKAGFPAGAFNIVVTQKHTAEVGLALCESPLVKKISFTGSTAVGKILMKQSASTMKKLSFELGGNAPLIVFDDADVDYAIEQVIACKFISLGQTCVCANRLYVQRAVVEEFSEKLAKRVRGFKIGHGLHKDTTHTCLINTNAVAKVERHAQDAISKGAEIVVAGGRLPEIGENFYAPTILKNVRPDSQVAHEETFGPLCAIIPFDTMEEVVGYANDTPFGLAAYVFSNNINTLYTAMESLDAGMISCNTGIFRDAAVPFGGVKESGFGREGSLHGIDDYTVLKTVILGGLPERL
ncbi:succinate-semialdehyde dehydrogenase (NAD(P)(+)) Ecym_5303 [Eremothecium cymbalariae DBVPG|uniref:Succinate-semialdehyde dehydrogenase n=1 Tax=Eremothecium cymbalariae (strain CBS 270.75 / DBVPG 7215 / KCTC 17166 / NRRL Y-17582) TaxID=931890 RepID=I6NDC3_ERECY|nr:hypothetical protein Ecym_5303 [Eremothecium cymbalariae DBVPG\